MSGIPPSTLERHHCNPISPARNVTLDESQPNVWTVTENVSPRGALIATDCDCAPGKRAPKEGSKSLACVIYCQRAESAEFAIGMII